MNTGRLRVGVHAAQVAARRGSTARACSCPGSRPRWRRRGATSRSGCRRRRSSACIWSAQLGRASCGSLIVGLLVRGRQPSTLDVEVADVEVVVGAQLRRRSGRTARRCSGACRARRSGWLAASRAIACSTDGVELEAEEVVDAPHGAHRIGDELAVVDVEEAVLADARARAAMACSTPTRRCSDTSRPSRCRSRSPCAAREDGRHDARPRRHRLGRVAVRHDEARVGVGRRRSPRGGSCGAAP